MRKPLTIVFCLPGNSFSWKFLECWINTVHYCYQNNKDVEGKSGLMEAAYTGFGFMLIKKGVFESMEYPWFRPVMKQIGNAMDFCMEDVGFCLTARERGYKIFVDPQVRVGHEKRVVL
jgi:hypothetical protein